MHTHSNQEKQDVRQVVSITYKWGNLRKPGNSQRHRCQLIDPVGRRIVGGRIDLVVAVTDDDGVVRRSVGEDLVELVEVGAGNLGGQVEEVVDVVLGTRVFMVT